MTAVCRCVGNLGRWFYIFHKYGGWGAVCGRKFFSSFTPQKYPIFLKRIETCPPVIFFSRVGDCIEYTACIFFYGVRYCIEMTSEFNPSNYFRFIQKAILRGCTRVMVSCDWMYEMTMWCFNNLDSRIAKDFTLKTIFGVRVEVCDFNDGTVMEIKYD